MVILNLVPKGKTKIIVELDDDCKFFLYQKEVSRLGLKKGDEISDQLMEDICQLIVYPRAKEKALSLLQYRNRTKRELKQRLLQNDYPEIIVDQVMGFLEEYHYIDDARYVQSYIEVYGKKKSRLQLQRELALKGISKEMFQNIWEELPEDTEEESLRKQVEKRIRGKGSVTTENYKKHYAYFARKGYAGSMIAKILRDYRESATEDFY